MPGNFIDIPAADGGSFKAYLAAPPAGRGPGIVLIQEIFGVNRHIRAMADGYAADGFVVLAPDVFWRIRPGFEAGYDASGIAQGIAIMGKVEVAKAVADLGTTTNALRARGECSGKVAALGYCMGGRFAFLAAANTGVDAAVCYYGGGIHTALDQAARAISPLLMHFGEKDDHIPLAAVDATRAAFKGRGDVEIHVYPGAGHGFNCDERGSYHAESARLARERSVAFLRKHLG